MHCTILQQFVSRNSQAGNRELLKYRKTFGDPRMKYRLTNNSKQLPGSKHGYKIYGNKIDMSIKQIPVGDFEGNTDL